MTKVKIWHNPRCSKSRQALALLEERRADIEVIEYLKTPPDQTELKATLDKLGIKPQEIVRTGEAIYKEQFRDREMSDADWLEALVAHPILIERPIVVVGDTAVIGRPPERALEVLG